MEGSPPIQQHEAGDGQSGSLSYEGSTSGTEAMARFCGRQMTESEAMLIAAEASDQGMGI